MAGTTAKSWFDGTLEVITGGSSVASGSTSGESQPQSSYRSTMTSTIGGASQISPLSQHSAMPSNNENSRPMRSQSSHGPTSNSLMSNLIPPSLSRVPSADTLDRSLHNSSLHGTSNNTNKNKSSAQIIKELRTSNSKLTERTAEMEADFMNQINKVSKSYEEKILTLEETNKKKDLTIKSINKRIQSCENRLREKDTNITKIKEESVFQRHTIADLKNQLYQLQHDIEEAEYDKQDGDDKFKYEKEELENEISRLKDVVSTYKDKLASATKDASKSNNDEEGYKKKLEDVEVKHKKNLTDVEEQYQKKLEDIKTQLKDVEEQHEKKINEVRSEYKQQLQERDTIHEKHVENLKKEFQEERDTSVSSLREETTNEVRQVWTQLDDTQKELNKCKAELSSAQNNTTKLEHDYKIKEAEYDNKIELLKKKIEKREKEHKDKEELLRNRLEEIEQDDIQLTKDLRAKVEEHEATISKLEDELDEAKQEVAELRRDNTKLINAAESQDQYRTDEVNDLRVLYDALETENMTLKEEKDELLASLDQQKDNFEGGKQRYDDEIHDLRVLQEGLEDENIKLKAHVEELKMEIETLKEERANNNRRGSSSSLTPMDEPSNTSATKKEPFTVKETDSELLKIKLDEKVVIIEQRDIHIAKLEADYDKLDFKNKELRKEITDLTLEKNSLLSKNNELEEAMVEVKIDLEKEIKKRKTKSDEDESRSAKRLRDIVTKTAQEKADLEISYEKQISEKQNEINNLKEQIKLKALGINTNSTESSSEDRDRVKDLSEQVRKLKHENYKLQQSNSHSSLNSVASNSTGGITGSSRDTNSKTKRQLREAQIALVALDDEKKRLTTKFHNQIVTMEKSLENLDVDYRNKIKIKDSTIKELKALTKNNKDMKDSSDLISEIAQLKYDILLKDKQITELQEQQKQQEGNSNTTIDGPSIVSPTSSPRPQDSKKYAELEELVEQLKKEKEHIEQELQEKLQDRDTTISALVKSSVIQEQNLSKLQDEINKLQTNGENDIGSSFDRDEIMSPLKQARSLGSPSTHNHRNNEEEVSKLRDALNEYKEVEEKLSREVMLLKNELKNTRSLSPNSIPGITASYSMMSDDGTSRLQERDDAIATLVKESINKETTISSLKNQIVILEKQVHNSPTLDELKRLQKESEIFAGQIIEQDEEMELLRDDVSAKESQMMTLKQEINSLKRKVRDFDSPTNNSKLMELQAELDELQEANKTQREELRELRRQLREAKVRADDYDDVKAELQQVSNELDQYRKGTRGNTSLQHELQEALRSKDEIERKMAQQLESMRRLRNSTVDTLENNLKEREATLSTLSEDNDILKETISELNSQLDEMKEELDMKTQIADDAKVSLLEMRRVLDEQNNDFEEREELINEVEKLREELSVLEQDREQIDALKDRMVNAEDDREEWEKGICDSYERKMELLKLNKDVTIDGLRKELVEYKAKDSEGNEELLKRIEQLDCENKDLREEWEAKMQLKNTKIYALEQTLAAQEQLVDNMRNEMDTLQQTMEQANITRRAEIEEMQQEMFDSSTAVTRHEREVTALQMKLDDTIMSHKAEVTKLEEKIATLEAETTMGSVGGGYGGGGTLNKNNPSQFSNDNQKEFDDRLEQVKERLEKLQWRNTSLQEENLKLRERLEKAENNLRTDNEDKYKHVALEEEIDFLSSRIKELEDENKQQQAQINLRLQEVQSARQTVSAAGPTIINANERPPSSKSKKSSKNRRTQSSPSPSPAGRLRFLKRGRSHKVETQQQEHQGAPTTTTAGGVSGKNHRSDDISTRSEFTF